MSHHHHGHDHDHHEHGHDDGHDHSHDVEPALQSHLYSQIEFDKITTLNENEPDTGQRVVQKAWADRMTAEPKLESDADEQILMTVPFAGTVRLHSILMRASDSDSAPKTMKVFINREGLDFSTAVELEPVQQFDLAPSNDMQDIQVKRPRFNNVYSISLFVEDNHGADCTELFYIGFKGDFMKLIREPVEVLYEAAANPQDHKAIVGTKELLGQSNRGL